MSKRLFPSDKLGRVLFFCYLFSIGYLYVWRLVTERFFIGTLGTILGVFYVLSPALCIIPFVAQLVALPYYFLKLHGHIAPAVLLALLLVVGFLLLKYLPIPPTLEEISFSWQRAEYDSIVQMAHNSQLQHGQDCVAQDQFMPPPTYYELSGKCIHVLNRDGMVVEFAPRTWERPIIYLQAPPPHEYASCRVQPYDGIVFKRLAEHWFICERFGVPR